MRWSRSRRASTRPRTSPGRASWRRPACTSSTGWSASRPTASSRWSCGRRATSCATTRHIGTGNYNPKTSRIYEDLGLLTADDQVGKDLTRLFNELSGYAIEKKFKRLLVAPLHLRKGLLKRINLEAENAREGKPSGIRLKLNSIVDEAIIDALYRASRAGVPIDLVVRGICSVRPGVPELSETIRIRSVLGRYLEHSRIFAFHNDGDPQVFIGSADMMHRNLDRRVEALVRLADPDQIRRGAPHPRPGDVG